MMFMLKQFHGSLLPKKKKKTIPWKHFAQKKKQFHGSFFLKKLVNLIRHDTTQAIYYPFFLR